jgi:hypothetical protein
MKKVLLILLLAVGCERAPDFVKDGKGYWINTYCVKSHTESEYGPHYGYNIMKGRYEWHTSSYTETVCDSSVTDTIEILKK